jgi:RNA polymerase sigma-70 factor (ECF subfamily)
MREVFLLSRQEGLPVNEIASRLSISEQTVKNQVSNAIKRLRVKFGNKNSGK